MSKFWLNFAVNGGLEKTIMREKEEEALGRLGLTRDNTYVE